ncbi:unnamed protein product, partial [Effrenium voratum]
MEALAQSLLSEENTLDGLAEGTPAQLTRLLQRLGRQKRHKLVLRILRAAQAYGLETNVVHWNQLLCSLERQKLWQEALLQLRSLQSRQLQ